MANVTKAQFDKAKARGAERMKGPLAKSVVYDAGRNRVVVTLTTGIEISFAPQHLQGLRDASADDLRDVVIEGKGLGLFWRKLDADFSVPNLLQGFTGTQRWMAAQIGSTGRKLPSQEKRATVADNGKRAGRPALRA